MSKREEFIDKTDRRKIPKLSYSIEYICDRIVDWYYHVETTKIAKLSMNITVRQSRQSGVARATCPD